MFNSSAISEQINQSIHSKNNNNNNNNNNNISINNNNNNNNNNKDNKMVEMVYSLLEMLRLSSAEEMSTKLLLMSQSPQICVEMRQLGCLSLLIQLLHQQNDDQIECNDRQKLLLSHEMRQKANKTLRNIITNSAKSKRELRILRLIEDLRSFVDLLRLRGHELSNDVVDHPSSSVAHLLKVSFDEQHRQVIGLLGGVYAIAQVIQYDYDYHKNIKHNSCITLRRYSLLALTNLTFGDSQTKSLLGNMKPFMRALVMNLESPAEELRQVVASVLRNLSWNADYISKQVLRDVGAVTTLTKAALEATKESTLKSVLSALWNLTAHCAPNRADFCKVEGALPFLISTLTYKSSNNTKAIVENGGGILRHISSHIVTNEEYREILRKHNTIDILLEQLKSTSLTVVSNSCVTLWNLSARNITDQKKMFESGAVPMLRNLINSRHEMIAMGASATLKNLFSSPIAGYYISMNGKNSLSAGNSCSMPSLKARKLKALKDEMNCNLSETCDNIESPKVSPTHSHGHSHRHSHSSTTYLPGRMYNSYSGNINPHQVSRSNSHDSIGSTHSEPVTKFRTIDHTFKSVTQDTCSIYPYNSQVMSNVYSTLPSNTSRMRKEKECELHCESDFDIYCGESLSQINISNSSTKSSTFTDTELDVDPEPTDYSQRYKEQPVDEFTAPRSLDSVKVYRTEGTPLNFSLASSLTDLREAGLRSINEEKETKFEETLTNIIAETNNSPETNEKTIFRKPIPPPKPKFSIPLKNAITGENIVVVNQTDTKSVTFDDGINISTSTQTKSLNKSNENVCEETPLMFSRSSSLGSLSSCDVKSDVCQSSVISEFSRRASEVVSPSDLPDSPCQSSSPSSPKQISYLVPNETQKTNQNMKDNNAINATNNDVNNVFEDRPINYATEGTPAVFLSLSTSLSSLHEDFNSMTKDISKDVQNNTKSKNDEEIDGLLDISHVKTEIICSSSEDEGEVELLAACISSGMKKESIGEKRTISRNSEPRIESKKVVVTQTPAKPIPSEHKPLSPFSRSAPDGRSSYLSSDCLRIFNSEGTPIALSHSNSMSELSISSNSKHEISLNQSNYHSDESEDEDIILQKCIESGMPTSNSNSNKSVVRQSPKTPKTTPNVSPNSYNCRNICTNKSENNDRNKQFFVEDTPIQLSQCHSSLSSLSIDDSDDGIEDQKLLEAAINTGMNQINKFDSKLIKESDNQLKLKDKEDDQLTYTVCQLNERKNVMKCEAKKMVDSVMISSVMTDSSCLSDLDNTKPLSLMDNIMFSSTESFSYQKIMPKPRNRSLVDKKSDDSQILLENVKPPSLMDDISMTQSYASISSDISDIALDFVVNTNASNEIIAHAAHNCALEMSSLTVSCDNTDTQPIDRMCPPSLLNRINDMSSIITPNNIELEFELSDTEVSEELPIDSEEVKTMTESSETNLDMSLLNSCSVTTLLPLESPTICVDVISDFAEEKRKLKERQVEIQKVRENTNLGSISSQEMERNSILDQKRMSPIGSEDLLICEHLSLASGEESDPDSHATYNLNSPRRAKIIKPVIRKVKSRKDEFEILTPSQSSLTSRSPMPRPLNVKHRCVVKATRTSALRSQLRSKSAETNFDEDFDFGHQEKTIEPFSCSSRNKASDYMTEKSFERNSDRVRSLKNSSVKEINAKNKEKSLLSNVRSKLSASLSSHNLGSSNVSLSSSSSNGLSPSCASFSRRLEVQSRIASLWKRSKSSPNEKTEKTLSKNSNKTLDLTRSVTARRSFGKSTKSSSSLMRSSTYEKLPQSAEEANQIEAKHQINKKHNRYNDNNANTSNSNTCYKKQESKRHANDKMNANLISSIKSNKNKANANANSSHNNNNINNNNSIIRNKTTTNESTANYLMPRSTQTSSSSDRSRRTCLVTAV